MAGPFQAEFPAKGPKSASVKIIRAFKTDPWNNQPRVAIKNHLPDSHKKRFLWPDRDMGSLGQAMGFGHALTQQAETFICLLHGSRFLADRICDGGGTIATGQSDAGL